MTSTTSAKTSNPSPKVFAYFPGSDGVDNTFDIIHLPSDTVIAAFHFWDDHAQAKRKARQFVNAMNALCGHAYVYSDGWAKVGELLEDESRAFTICTAEKP
jgi:hypothetical protein